ncbi:MAG TPA: hypothetical protein VGS98_08745 [Thermoanaerobaculia bacterium]|jgi:hypothetical protein|nr:hypothetical protein [Thermoanaerobaculia bacterium]
MSITLADEKPDIQHKGSRANFSWRIVEPWDERRLAAFLMVKHRRNETDWTRRPSPFFASLGRSRVECSIPLADTDPVGEVEKLLTVELRGILAGADRVYREMLKSHDWRQDAPP